MPQVVILRLFFKIIMKSHVFNLVLFSFLISFFFAVLYNDTYETAKKHFIKWFLILCLGSIAFAYLMYFFPRNPYFG